MQQDIIKYNIIIKTIIQYDITLYDIIWYSAIYIIVINNVIQCIYIYNVIYNKVYDMVMICSKKSVYIVHAIYYERNIYTRYVITYLIY